LTTPQQIRAIVVADGDVPEAEQLPAAMLSPDGLLVVAADGGLRKAERLGLQPTLVVGDGDSLSPEELDGLAARGIELQLHPADKEQSDTELAVHEAVRRGARSVVVLGGLGGVRFEHALANLLLLAHPDLADCDIRVVDDRTTIRVVGDGGTVEVTADAGRLISLLPLSQRVAGVRTGGLRFALDNEALDQGPTRGLSNEITGRDAWIRVGRGRLAVVQTRTSDDGMRPDGNRS